MLACARPSADGCLSHPRRAAGPGSCVLQSAPGPFGVSLFPPRHTCSNPGSLCSPSLECSLLILPPMLHIPLGASKNVFCGSEPSNLPLQSAPTPSLCLRASASGCKTLMAKTYGLESSALNPGPGVWGEGAGVTRSVLADAEGNLCHIQMSMSALSLTSYSIHLFCLLDTP